MAIKRTTKVDSGFSMSSMTDIVFLLLIFFLVTSTLINPNALKLLLPKSTGQVSAKATVSVSIKHWQETDRFSYHCLTNISRSAKPRARTESAKTRAGYRTSQAFADLPAAHSPILKGFKTHAPRFTARFAPLLRTKLSTRKCPPPSFRSISSSAWVIRARKSKKPG